MSSHLGVGKGFSGQIDLTKISIPNLVKLLVSESSGMAGGRALRNAFYMTSLRFTTPLKILKVLEECLGECDLGGGCCEEEKGGEEEREEELVEKEKGDLNKHNNNPQHLEKLAMKCLRMIVFLKGWCEERFTDLVESEETRALTHSIISRLISFHFFSPMFSPFCSFLSLPC